MRARSYAQRVTRLAAAYRDAEARVVGAFFDKRPKGRDHLRWLRAQGFKEHSAIKPILDALAALHPKIDRGIGRHEYVELTEKLADETRHARLIMDLIEKISHKPVTPRELTWLPEDRKLARVRARYSRAYAGLLHGSQRITAREIERGDERLERAAITLTEGGGGALYQVCGRLRKRGIEAEIGKAFREILADEVEHKDSGARSLAPLVRNRAAFERASEIVAAISAQRLRMRNEQFGFPLSAEILANLDVAARQAADS
jgi:hypothetical protein